MIYIDILPSSSSADLKTYELKLKPNTLLSKVFAKVNARVGVNEDEGEQAVYEFEGEYLAGGQRVEEVEGLREGARVQMLVLTD